MRLLGVEPLDVAEVLTVGQTIVLGEDAIGRLDTAGVVADVGDVEGEEVAFALHDLEGFDTVDVVFALLVSGEGDELDADGIVESGLIEDDVDVVLFPSFDNSLDG